MNRNEKDTTVFEEAIALEPGRMAGEHEKILADESYNSYNHRKLSYLHRGLAWRTRQPQHATITAPPAGMPLPGAIWHHGIYRVAALQGR